LPIETQEKIAFFFDHNAPPSGVDLDDLSRFASSETFKDIGLKFPKFQSLSYLRKWGNNYNSYRKVPSPRQLQQQKIKNRQLQAQSQRSQRDQREMNDKKSPPKSTTTFGSVSLDFYEL